MALTIKDYVAIFERELDTMLKSSEHEYQCTAHSEGQSCCLDKYEAPRDFIIRWIVKNLKELGIEEGE